MTIQQQYITQWHDGFVNYVGSLLGVIARLVTRPKEMRLQALHIPIIENL